MDGGKHPAVSTGAPLTQAPIPPWIRVRVTGTDGWVVGDRGTIYRYDGATWNIANTHWTSFGFYGLDFLTPDDGWAVGVLTIQKLQMLTAHWLVFCSLIGRNYFASLIGHKYLLFSLVINTFFFLL